MKRIAVPVTLAIVATLLVVVPVLAAYFAYIYIEESDGNSYDSLPIIANSNITQLVETHFISSTGLDTRVLTGSGEVLPHMLAEDKLLFVTDLAAYEDKTLLFYLGATSLSSFPIVVGYNGSFETPDDPDLELGYVMELLLDGYFDASAGSDKNILYKENAFRVWVSAADTLKVAAYNSTGDEQWSMDYSSFDSGEHTVYILCNGIKAALYVDDFVTAKDTAALYYSSTVALDNSYDTYLNVFSRQERTFYASGRYWAFWRASEGDDYIHYRSSTDGSSWDTEATFAIASSSHDVHGFGVWFDGTYMHIAYGDYDNLGSDCFYRMGTPETDGTITWAAGWQTVSWATYRTYIRGASAVADINGYPYIIFYNDSVTGGDHCQILKSSTNNGTWTTAAGYPVEYYSYTGGALTAYPNSSKLYAVIKDDESTGPLIGKYYNGSTWASGGTIDTTGQPGINSEYGCVADNDDNVYIVWTRNNGTHYSVHFRLRYSDGTFSSIIDIAGAVGDNARYPSVSYNPDTDIIYITYTRGSGLKAVALESESGFSSEYSIYGLGGTWAGVAAQYGSHIGILTSYPTFVNHGYLDFFWEWNDNANNWTWMQNNVMSYADDFQMAVDGYLVLEYKPAAIIQGTTLPDEEEDHDATITWGSNPAGVNVTISDLQTDSAYNQTYYYQFVNPGTQDIIQPAPPSMTTDVDTAGLVNNPLYPGIQAIAEASNGKLTERLVWLIAAWFALIAAMLFVHIGFDTRKDTEKPHHFVLTTIVGLGLSILFYTMGIFPLWIVIVLAFGFVGAIIYERQPVL